MSRFSRSAIVIASLTLAAPLGAQTTIFSTFGPGDTYGGSGWTIGSPESGAEIAGGFVYGGVAGYQLTGFRAAIRNIIATGPLLATFWEGPDRGTASLLESWTVPAPSTGILTFVSALNPVLTVGNSYWVSFMTDPSNAYSWYWSDPQVVGLFAYGGDYTAGVWTTAISGPLGAFDVQAGPASTVPEPATMTLLASGLAGMAAARRRKRSQQM